MGFTRHTNGGLVVNVGRIFLRLSKSLFLSFLAILTAFPAIAHEQPKWIVSNLGAQINTPQDEGFPAIAENGLVLYFARWNTSAAVSGGDEDWNIFVSTRPSLDAPWGEPRRLTGNTVEDGYSAFSADGRRNAFHSDRGGSMAICVMNAGGNEQTPVIPRWPAPRQFQTQ